MSWHQGYYKIQLSMISQKGCCAKLFYYNRESCLEKFQLFTEDTNVKHTNITTFYSDC
jgi:hypothetical protein